MADSDATAAADARPGATPRWVLGLDAATPPSSAALVRDDEVVAWRTGPFGPRTDAWILGAVDELLSEAGVGLGQLAMIAAGVGPGTFTGIRVAIATTQGLARGAGVPAAGICTLAGLARCARAAPGTDLLPLIDARRGQLYGARYTAQAAQPDPVQEPFITTADEIVARHGQFGGPLLLGTGVATDARLRELPQAELQPWPAAAGIALLGRALLITTGTDALPPPLPAYLRAPDAKVGRNPLERP